MTRHGSIGIAAALAAALYARGAAAQTGSTAPRVLPGMPTGNPGIGVGSAGTPAAGTTGAVGVGGFNNSLGPSGVGGGTNTGLGTTGVGVGGGTNTGLGTTGVGVGGGTNTGLGTTGVGVGGGTNTGLGTTGATTPGAVIPVPGTPGS